MSAPLLSTRDLTVQFEGLPVLQNVSLDIARGEIVTVVGPNGSGKSTLLKALLGTVPPESGSVQRAPAISIGYVPQKLALDASLPISVARFLSLPKRQSAARIAAQLDRVGVAGLQSHPMQGLSGGQFQRVLLARALLMSPDLLILDEATQGLDQPGVARFYRLIEEVRRDMGCAVLMVSHDLHVVMSASDRVICLNGHVCCQGTPHVVRSAPEYRALFGLGTEGTLALYQHEHDHAHDAEGTHIHGPDCAHAKATLEHSHD
ncbi:Zinc import ATP-binding protein ZnuC [Aquimixticola soesokkakensis]|uniref:Zinc import ATP-binding protein ZnuC n=1 Tax=Aquimixticola soesokkakensis TaxID=1519096 RepID=A0A1Y5RK52_9RHOB|nr:metal ABC transporter ATP-binding protein [Aquimixticola soesokkakensis]SLN19423.1 Zinc import ATP-binding protein ZnuC [Aquimixticola soesokkakensis]